MHYIGETIYRIEVKFKHINYWVVPDGARPYRELEAAQASANLYIEEGHIARIIEVTERIVPND